MNVEITLPGTGADDLRSLFNDLSHEFELRGRVSLVEESPTPGTLGGITDTLVVALGPSGIGVVLASAVVMWVRNRATEVMCKLTRPDGTVAELSTKRLRGCDTAALQHIVRELSGSLEAQPAATPEIRPASQAAGE